MKLSEVEKYRTVFSRELWTLLLNKNITVNINSTVFSGILTGGADNSMFVELTAPGEPNCAPYTSYVMKDKITGVVLREDPLDFPKEENNV